MDIDKLKTKLLKTIEDVSNLPDNYKTFNKIKIQESLLQYVIFIEEFEQSKTLTEHDIKNELLIINEYLDMIQDTLI